MACPTQQSLRFVGDGREDARESTLAGIARPAKMTVCGARRAPPQKSVGRMGRQLRWRGVLPAHRLLQESRIQTRDIRYQSTPSVRMRVRENLLDARISRAFAHLPHRKERRWRRRKN